MKKFGFTRKILDFSRVYLCCCNFFVVEILDDFHDFVSECVSFPNKINNPFWDVAVFPKKMDSVH